MFRNHLKIALRNISRHKFISFVNLFGLTVGIASCLLIIIYVLHELSYDKYNDHPENVYRVTRIFRNQENGNVSLHLGTVAPPIGPLLKHEFPQIEKMTQLLGASNVSVRYKEKVFTEYDIYFADENLFDIFKINVTEGNPRTALSEPYSVMLSEEVAAKYFGSEDPMNKVVRLDNTKDFKVTGVYKAFPANSHLHPSVMGVIQNTQRSGYLWRRKPANKLVEQFLLHLSPVFPQHRYSAGGSKVSRLSR